MMRQIVIQKTKMASTKPKRMVTFVNILQTKVIYIYMYYVLHVLVYDSSYLPNSVPCISPPLRPGLIVGVLRYYLGQNIIYIFC